LQKGGKTRPRQNDKGKEVLNFDSDNEKDEDDDDDFAIVGTEKKRG